MEEQLKSSILLKTDELVNIIKDSTDYKRYVSLKKELSKNDELNSLISSIKEKQKEIVRLEHYNKDKEKEEKELTFLIEKLEGYPSYVELTYLQEDLNDLFQEIRMTIEEYINKKIK